MYALVMFADLREKTWTGVREFVEAAEAVLQEIGSEQERGNVKEYPNERTIRYYLSEGLIPQPEDKKGTASVFGYSHMLALIVVKKLQSQGLPNHVIRELVGNRADDELEKLLGEEIRVKTVDDPNQVAYFSALSPAQLNEEFGEEVQILRSVALRSTKPTNKAAAYLKSLLFEQASSEPAEKPPISDVPLSRASSMRIQPPRSKREQKWTRLEISRGLELHVRDDLLLPTGGIGEKEIKELEDYLSNAKGTRTKRN